MNDIQMKTLDVLVNGGYVPIDRFRSEELAAIDDLVSLGYALVNPTEPVREAYATEEGKKALAVEKDVRCQRTERDKSEKVKQFQDKTDKREEFIRELIKDVALIVFGGLVGKLLDMLF